MERAGNTSVAADPGWLADPDLPDALGLMGRRDFTLLIVDDSPGLREEVRKLLGRVDFIAHFREAEDGIDGYKKVLTAPPDLILCDLVMPSVDGFKFLSLVRGRAEVRDIPVILLTGKTDVETKIRGLELGASDYVTKPFDGGELLARIKVQLKIKALQDALRRSNDQLQKLSSIDPLTLLYNRRFFMKALSAEYERSVRHDPPLSFVMVDIDHFKNLNDNYGHQAGDDVLRGMGDVIREQIRTSDIPARYGGEEFCILLPETPVKGAAEFAQRLRLAVELRSFCSQGRDLRCTVSIGVASCPSAGVSDEEDLIRLADEALYEAKFAGRNRVVVREP